MSSYVQIRIFAHILTRGIARTWLSTRAGSTLLVTSRKRCTARRRKDGMRIGNSTSGAATSAALRSSLALTRMRRTAACTTVSMPFLCFHGGLAASSFYVPHAKISLLCLLLSAHRGTGRGHAHGRVGPGRSVCQAHRNAARGAWCGCRQGSPHARVSAARASLSLCVCWLLCLSVISQVFRSAF